MRRGRYRNGTKIQGGWTIFGIGATSCTRTPESEDFWQTVSPFHVTSVSSLPAFLGVVWFLFGLLGLFGSFAGSDVDAFLNSASMDMTATVSSNAALEQKRLSVHFVFSSRRGKCKNQT